MEYSIYKLKFKTPVHFGKGRLNTSTYTVYADTLFSAIYKEAITLFGEKEAKGLYDFCVNGQLKISDTMPYRGKELYVPKPILNLNIESQDLSYIAFRDIDRFIKGEYTAGDDENKFGESSTRYGVKVNRFVCDDNSEPFNVETFSFEKDCGIYFIVVADNSEPIGMIDSIIEGLSYTGIGGKLSSGLGKFEYIYEDVSDSMKKMFNGNYETYMTLSTSLPKESEIQESLKNSSYELVKRSGFVSSANYSKTGQSVKKKDFYCFKAGSCFKSKFVGDVFDVSDNQIGCHSVYRYAMPIFIGIK